MAYLGDTTTAHNAAPPPRSTTTTPARVTYPCSHRQCQLGVQGVGAEQRNPLTLPSYQRLESAAAIQPLRANIAPRSPLDVVATATLNTVGSMLTPAAAGAAAGATSNATTSNASATELTLVLKHDVNTDELAA